MFLQTFAEMLKHNSSRNIAISSLLLYKNRQKTTQSQGKVRTSILFWMAAQFTAPFIYNLHKIPFCSNAYFGIASIFCHLGVFRNFPCFQGGIGWVQGYVITANFQKYGLPLTLFLLYIKCRIYTREESSHENDLCFLCC